MSLDLFHPAVRAWFAGEFAEPTPPQQMVWPAIYSGRNTLIAAPTGSGKTLAAFLAAIDMLVRQAVAGELEDATQILYVSPLKALSNDIERNLRCPLAGIARQLESLGADSVQIRAQVRTGDTTPAERTAMSKRPPHILVTTPESLYLMLTSNSGRSMLKTVRSVIVDEIHAIAGTKRGAHLSLSLERLTALAAQPFLRIGLSATQNPIAEVARFLTGGDAEDCVIVDTGHWRERDLALELPDTPLEAVMSTEVWDEIYDRLAMLIGSHRTTLVFVNTRRMAERVTRHLGERLGKEHVASHHGSMAKEQRLAAEQQLKAGSLKAIVATASLELGIDIGDIDLVCQIGSPRSISAFLQRVGRSGHSLNKTPRGRLFPLSRDELVECAALLQAARLGELDQLNIPQKPLDVLAQQIVAEVAARDWNETELYERMRCAYPYRCLTRVEFDAITCMLADGFSTRRGRHAAYLHHDAVNHRLRARRGARLTALTCGGAIPDNADYQVLLAPSDVFIGTLNEDFAVESMVGDIFQLGNMSYRILKTELGRVHVEDANGQLPTIPFWLGEAPSRSDELSAAVSRLRDYVAKTLANLDPDGLAHASFQLMTETGLTKNAADQITQYLGAAKGVLGTIPTQQTIVLERFFDESGGMQLVIHTPFGSRINRAWGIALRKRFCRKFNFELQAAATDDAIVLSLGETHSFSLDEVGHYLHSSSVRDVLIQALLAAPLFTTRWRWNATTALAIKRFQGGRKNPPQLQRMQAEDLVAVVFPDQIACAENIVGDREVPDHPLVNQTILDCLHDAMDLDGLVALLCSIESGAICLVARDLPLPSPLAREILNAKPYAFLDDAPLEERRTQAVMNRRWLDPASAADFGQLDAEAIRRVRDEAWPVASSPDELHDALMLLGAIAEDEGAANSWERHFATLISTGRAARLHSTGGTLWVATEQLPMLLAVFPGGHVDPKTDVPPKFALRVWTHEQAFTELMRGRLQGLGPISVSALARKTGCDEVATEHALLKLETEGFALRGRFTPDLRVGMTEWCERRLLARIHRYTIKKLRADIEPASASNFLRFLLEWHGLGDGLQPEGPQALAAILEQLEGFEAACSAWESDILPGRMQQYDPQWLDSLCLSGRVVWGRFAPPRTISGRKRAAAPVRSTPIALLTRRHLEVWYTQLEKERNGVRLSAQGQALTDYLRTHGASFFDEIVHSSGLLTSQAESALGELVAAGVVNSDSFSGLRALLISPDRRRNRQKRRHAARFGIEDAGRWALLQPQAAVVTAQAAEVTDTAIEHIARVLLHRYGVIFKRMLEREGAWLPPWYQLLRVYRQLEARGEIRGGRFVNGFSGEQYALPEAVENLRKLRRKPATARLVTVSASDPLNVLGIITPGMRVPALATNRILFRGGVPIAVHMGGKTHFLEPLDPAQEWEARNALLRPQPAGSEPGYIN